MSQHISPPPPSPPPLTAASAARERRMRHTTRDFPRLSRYRHPQLTAPRDPRRRPGRRRSLRSRTGRHRSRRAQAPPPGRCVRRGDIHYYGQPGAAMHKIVLLASNQAVLDSERPWVWTCSTTMTVTYSPSASPTTAGSIPQPPNASTRLRRTRHVRAVPHRRRYSTPTPRTCRVRPRGRGREPRSGRRRGWWRGGARW